MFNFFSIRFIQQFDFVYELKRGVVKRGNTVAWPNGIVPYIIASGYRKKPISYFL